MGPNGDVAVTDSPRGNEDGGPGRELYSQTKVKENEVPTFGGIVGAACEDGTEAIGNVGVVDMLQGHNPGAAVKRAGGENAVAEWLLEAFVPLKKCTKAVCILSVELWGVEGESA